MSKGLGVKQREILDRLRRIRCEELPDLWHRLQGSADPWPDPRYSGHSGYQEEEYSRAYESDYQGQNLCLYTSESPRSVQVSFRRAAATLHAQGLVEMTADIHTQRLLVRLPMTNEERSAVQALREQHRRYVADHEAKREAFLRSTPPGTFTADALRKVNRELPHTRWIAWFEQLDILQGRRCPQTATYCRFHCLDIDTGACLF